MPIHPLMSTFDPADLQKQVRELLGGLVVKAMKDPQLAPLVLQGIGRYSQLLASNPEIAGLVGTLTRLFGAERDGDGPPHSEDAGRHDDVIDVEPVPSQHEMDTRMKELNEALKSFESNPSKKNADHLSAELGRMRVWLNAY